MKKLGLFILMVTTLLVTVACAKDDRIQVGILQFLSHEDLDQAREGFIEALEEEGFVDGDNITITLLNPQADAQTMQTQAAQLVRNSDLILAIATPAAVAVVNEAKDKGRNIPILFTAVTDPLDAKLVTNLAKPGGNVTGTSDLNPIVDQMSLVKRIKPDAKSVGILYTSSETNSKVQSDLAVAELTRIGLGNKISTINTLSDLPHVFGELVKDVDVIYIPSDNLLASSMGAVEVELKKHANLQVPIITTTILQVENGGTLTFGLSYFNLGRQTGTMAAKILNGQNAGDIAVETIVETELIINKKQLVEVLELEIPQSLLDEADKIIE